MGQIYSNTPDQARPPTRDTLFSADGSMGELRTILLTTLIFLAAMIIGLLLHRSIEQQSKAEQREVVAEIAASEADSLQRQLDRALSSTLALATILRQGGGKIENFEGVASDIIVSYGGISTLQLAPDGVVSQVYPLERNEAVLGHDLLNDPRRRAEAIAAIESGELTLAGPVDLLQGGKAIIGRLPVFLPDEGGKERFWGFTIAIIELPDFLASTDLYRLAQGGYQYELARRDPESERWTVFHRSGPSSLADPVIRPIEVPNGRWLLLLAPEGGWQSPSTLPGLLLVLASSFLLSCLAYTLLRQPDILRREVEFRTRKLAEANRRLRREEAALRESEERFRTLFESAPIAIVLADADGTFIETNEVFQQMLGYPAERFVGAHLLEFTDPEDQEVSRQLYTELVRGERGIFHLEKRYRGAGNRLYWGRLAVSAIRDPEGLFLYAVAMIENITERKRDEARLRLLESVIINTRDAILITTHPPEGGGAPEILYANPAFGKLMGYRENEVIGLQLDLLWGPNPERASWEQVEGAMRRGEPTMIETLTHRKDGSSFWSELSIAPVTDPEGPQTYWVTIQRDISERKRVEKQIRQLNSDLEQRVRARTLELESANRVKDELLGREREVRAEAERLQQRFAFLAEASSTLTTSLDYEQTLQSLARLVVPHLADWCLVDILDEEGGWQLVAVEHTNPEKIELVRDFRKRHPLSLETEEGLQRILDRRESLLLPQLDESLLLSNMFEPERIGMFRQLGICSLMIVPLSARERRFGIISLASAESARSFSSEELALAEEVARRAALALDNARLYQEAQAAIHARDQFISVASHELKTPITSVMGYVNLLQRRARRDQQLPEQTSRALHIIHEETLRLNRLIELLLDVSRIQMGRLELEFAPLDLCALTRRLVEITQPTVEQHELRLSCPEKPILIYGDALRLEQVLQNLLGNAVKYSPHGGVITIELRVERGCARLVVSDEGIGIPSEAVQEIFSRFYRSKNVSAMGISGMGLGLHIVHHIVEAHGGAIEVKSEEGAGSTFVVTLPPAEQLP